MLNNISRKLKDDDEKPFTKIEVKPCKKAPPIITFKCTSGLEIDFCIEQYEVSRVSIYTLSYIRLQHKSSNCIVIVLYCTVNTILQILYCKYYSVVQLYCKCILPYNMYSNSCHVLYCIATVSLHFSAFVW